MKNLALLLDTNILLDWVLQRRPFHQSSSAVIELCLSGDVDGFVAVHSVLNFYYVTRKDYSTDDRRLLSQFLCERFNIVGVDREIVLKALSALGFKDLEDDLQIQCAIETQMDYIITRDVKGFASSDVKIISPDDFLSIWRDFLGGLT